MNLRPNQPLDAEERALAAMLPRPHGRKEPGPGLDARILAAARAATEPSRATPATPRRRNWIAPAALAASLMLAVGLAWQLRPAASLQAPMPAAETASADAGSDDMKSRAMTASPPEGAATSEMQPRSIAATPPPAEPVPSARAANEAAASAIATQPDMAAAPSPPSPPPSPAPAAMDRPAGMSMPASQAAEAAGMAAPAITTQAARADDVVRDRAASAGSTEARAQRKAGTDMTTLETATGDAPEAPEDDVPPATADSPEVREAWLRRIGELLNQGKTEEAKASLAEFRRRYPDAALPAELRKLVP